MHTTIHRQLLLIIALTALASTARGQNGQIFEPLGTLPGNSASVGFAVSADGSVIVGRGSNEAMRWTRETGMVGLGNLPGGFFSTAYDVSEDGKFVIGTGNNENSAGEGFFWSDSTGMVGLGAFAAGTPPQSIARGVTANGPTIVGYSWVGTNSEAFRWNPDDGMVGLGLLPGDTRSTALDISADGETISGTSSGSLSTSEAVRWTDPGGIASMGLEANITGISDNGEYIVGFSVTVPVDGFRWSVAGEMEVIGPVAPEAASADGSTIVGRWDQDGFLWTEADSLKNLRDLLETKYGIDLSEWSAIYPLDVSADGSVITGWGNNPDGMQEAFRIDLGQAITIIDPKPDTLLVSAEAFKLKWSRSDSTRPVNVLFFPDTLGAPFETLILAFDNDSLLWTPPDTLFTRSARIAVVDATNPSAADTSETFRIKPRHLTRLSSDSTRYEPFDVDRHGWSFGNTQPNLFPPSWWQQPQFDYLNGEDPFVEETYPPVFTDPPVSATPPVFPDWLSMVHAYGEENSYSPSFFGSDYSPGFLSFWGSYHGGTFWGGSCAGLSLASLLAFGHRSAFSEMLPGLDSVHELFDLTAGADERTVANRLQASWRGKVQADYRNATGFFSLTPRDILGQLKVRLMSDDRSNDSYLYISDAGGSGAHAVVPYRLTRDSADATKWRVFVYDPNQPSNELSFVSLDSLANTWSYNGFTPAWGGPTGMAVADPIVNYLSTAIPPANGLPAPAPDSWYVSATPGAAVAITSENGSIGYGDSVAFSTIEGAVPDLPPVGGFTPPIGYDIPAGTYTIATSNHPNTLAAVSLFKGNDIYTYGRSDAAPLQTDRLSISETGFAVSNPDNEKMITLQSIRVSESSEKAYELGGIVQAPADSLVIHLDANDDLMLVNSGAAKTYHLRVKQLTTERATFFEHATVPVAAASAHRIVPNWNDLIESTVEILIDHENDGAVDDTLFLVNMSTDLGTGPELPESSFGLAQNYPNPFATTTTIPYSIEHAGHVSLIVYDILGREVQRIVDRHHGAGTFSVSFDAEKVPSGTYYYRLVHNSGSTVKSMLVVR